MNVNLNVYEVQEIHDLLNLVCGRAPGMNEHLETGLRKLRRAGRSRLCQHCRVNMSQRKDRICNACNTYREFRGELPERDVLDRRAS